MKKIAVFVDVQNIYYTTREVFQRQFNYTALWQKLTAEGDIVFANAYAIDRNNDKQKKFQSALKQIGFNIKLKPYIQRRDGSAKGDWDVGITIDLIQQSKHVDKIILLSGDGDFDVLLKHVQGEYQVDVEVYGVASLTATSMKNSASRFHPIEKDLLL